MKKFNAPIDVTNVGKDVMYDVMHDKIKHLSERQRNILNLITQDNKVTATEMSRMTGMSERTIRRDLAAMSHIVMHVGDRNNRF